MTAPPTDARLGAIDARIRFLKAAGIWDQLDILYRLAAHDEQAARLNWRNPGTFTLIAVNSPVFVVDRGFAGDGSTSRLRTQYTPSIHAVKYLLNDASMWARSLTNVQGSSIAGKSVSTLRLTLQPRTASDLLSGNINDSVAANIANTSSIGLFAIQRTASNIKRRWKDGVQLGADLSTVSEGLPDSELWICGGNSNTFSTAQVASMAVGASLTGLEAAYTADDLAWMQAVGAA